MLFPSVNSENCCSSSCYKEPNNATLAQLFDFDGPEHIPQKRLFTCFVTVKQFSEGTERGQVGWRRFLSDRNCNNDHFKPSEGERDVYKQ